MWRNFPAPLVASQLDWDEERGGMWGSARSQPPALLPWVWERGAAPRRARERANEGTPLCCNAGLSAGCRERRTYRHCRNRSKGWRQAAELAPAPLSLLSPLGCFHLKPSVKEEPAKGTSGTSTFRMWRGTGATEIGQEHLARVPGLICTVLWC